MTFNALNKELFMLHQGYQEGMSEYGVWLAHHVWVIQTEFPRWRSDEHLKGVKQGHFYEGLKEGHQVMLVHKMEGKHPATYTKLLKAVRQIKKWSQARDPTSQLDGPSNVQATTSTSLFPSCRLKGNYLTFSGRAAVLEDDEDCDVGDDAQEEDSSDAEKEGPWDTGASEPSEEYMV